MLKKQLSRKNTARPTRSRKSKLAVAITLVLVAIVSASLLAQVNSRRRSKGASGEVSEASLSAGSPSKEYIYAGGRLVATEEPTTTTSLSAPTNLRATTSSSTSIHITWSSAVNATRYELQKSSNYGAPNYGFSPLNSNIGVTSFDDITVTNGNAYIYQVLAIDQNNNYSAPSNLDVATAFAFTEDPISAGMTIKEVHITQLRQTVDAFRLAAGRSAATWSNPPPLAQTIVIQRLHVDQLRSYLDDARTALALPPPTYTDPTITQFITVIKAAHIQQLRQLVKGYRTVTG